jgi:hypothetical protein
MADNIEHLMLEQFRRVREDIAKLTDAVHYIHKQQLSDRLLLRSLQTSLDANSDLLTGLTARVSRIERRLELSDDPMPTGLAEETHPFDPARR